MYDHNRETYFPQITQTHTEFENKSNFEKFLYTVDINLFAAGSTLTHPHDTQANPRMCAHTLTVYTFLDNWLLSVPPQTRGQADGTAGALKQGRNARSDVRGE